MVPKVFYAVALHETAHDIVHKLPRKGLLVITSSARLPLRLLGLAASFPVSTRPQSKTPIKLKPVIDF